MLRFLAFVLILLCAPHKVFATTFAAWDTLNKDTQIDLSNSNLTATGNSNARFGVVLGTIGKSSGKWYWEYTVDTIDGLGNSIWGVGGFGTTLTTYVGHDADGYGNYPNTGSGANKVNNNSFQAYGNSAVTGDIIGISLDMDAGEISISINGVDQGVMYTGLTGTLYPAFSTNVIGNAVTANFGQSAFVYSVPSGYNAGLYDGSAPTTTIWQLPTSTPTFKYLINNYGNAMITIGATVLLVSFFGMIFTVFKRLV